ncbi:diacylglycerol/lipid kinase family protein [Amycolatopsis pithecellobii]|uniref:Diacylglycerol kinase n=1 Tax=Amycolatopsis pithecellobii TaxID=664692 RepID=A0A6N7YQA4_9PSEU|nr:diacylglycerol kinase family protein [Amycolatopsis pithecellobii]MTD55197.1 diacylglycerol kinase [Amycolatopsis pithecellobii]
MAGRVPGEGYSPSRRVAAAIALLCLPAAVAAVVWSLVRSPLQLALGLALVVVAVLAAWTALVHHGISRLLATVAAVVALAATTALPEARVVVVLAAVTGLTVLAAAAAKFAIARDLAPATNGHAVGPARHGVLLMNPKSGGGKVVRFGLEQKARELGITPIVLQRGDDLRKLAEQAVADGADVLGMAGGDGSQALTADVARQHGVAFVCVPAGTRNHFALDLGLDRDDVPAALAAFGDAVERRVDLALLGDRVFVNNVSLGVYATVVQSAAYRDAKLATTTQILPELLGPDAPGFDLRFARPDGSHARTADVVLVSNGVYHLNSFAGLGTRTSLEAGVLGVVTLDVDRARDVPALLSAEAAGKPGRFRGYHDWTAREFEIGSGQPLLDVGVDGEALRLPPPLRFRSLPGALRVRTPVDAGAAAAAPPVHSTAAVTALWRVLRDRPVRGPE